MFLRTKKAVEDAALQGSANTPPPRKATPSIIATDMHILGNIVTEGMVDVDGSIEGNVKADIVTIRAKGKIKGDVVAACAHVYGEVCGLIRAQTVHLYSSCHVEGVLIHQSLTVEDGAFVDAKFKRLKDKAEFMALSSSDSDEDEGSSDMLPIAGNTLRLISA